MMDRLINTVKILRCVSRTGGLPIIVCSVIWFMLMTSLVYSQDVIRASGGTDISIDNIASGTYTTLSGPTIRETAGGQLAANQTIVLELPSGYEWNGDLTEEDVSVEVVPVGAQNTRLEVVFSSATTEKITFTVTVASTTSGAGLGPGRVTFHGLQLIPTSATVPNSGHITNTGTVNTEESNYGNLSTAVGALSEVRVETAPDGSGEVAGTQNILAGNSLTVYSIARDAGGNFRENIALDIEEDWSLIDITGGVTSSGLTPASNRRSAVFSSEITGSARIRAHYNNSSLVESGVITVIPRQASQMIIHTQPSGNAVAGEPFPVQPVIHLLDQFGNLVTSDSETIVTVSVETGDGELSGQLEKSAANGMVRFDEGPEDSLGLNKSGTVSLRFESSRAGAVVSNPVAVSSAAPYRLKLTSVPTSGTVNTNLAPPVRVQLQDFFQNNVAQSGITITPLLAEGSGVISATAVQSGPDGEAVFEDIQFNEPGVKAIRVISSDLQPDTSSVINILADDEVSGFQIVKPDNSAIGTVTAGEDFDIKITAVNGAGDLIDTFNGTVIVSSSSALPDGGGETPEFVNGILENHRVTLTGAGEHILTAQLPEDTSISGSTSPFTVLPGMVDFGKSLLTSDPHEIVADGSSQALVTVQLRDEFENNLITGGETITITTDKGNLTTSTESNQLEVVAEDQVNGTYTATLTASSQAETATIRAFNHATEIALLEIPFIPGNVVSFTVNIPQHNSGESGNPASQTAGTPFPVTVTAMDASGNRVTGYETKITFTTSSLFFDDDTEELFQVLEADMIDGKLEEFELALAQTGNAVTITVTDEHVFGLTGTSESFPVVAHLPDLGKSTANAVPAVIQNVSDNFSVITVILRDRFSNRIFTDFSANLQLSAMQTEPGNPDPFELSEDRLSGTVFLPVEGVYRDTLYATDAIERVEILALFDDSPLLQTANVSIVVPNTWQPSGSPQQQTDWRRSDNWSLGSVPASTDYVIIPGGQTAYPDLDLNIQVAGLDILSGGELILFGGNTIEIAGTIRIDGSLDIEDNTELFIGGNLIGSGFFEAGESARVAISGDLEFQNFFARTDGASLAFNGEIRQTVSTSSFFVQELNISNEVLITGAEVIDIKKLIVESSQVFELVPDGEMVVFIESSLEGGGGFILKNNTLVLRGDSEIATLDATEGTVIFGVHPPTEEIPNEEFAGIALQHIINPGSIKNAVVNNPEGVRTYDDIFIDQSLTLRNGPLIISSGRSLIAPEIIYPDSGDESLTGTLQFRRSINSVRGWRMLSAPVGSTIADLTQGLVVQGLTGSSWPDRQPNFLYYDETDGDTDLQRWRAPESMETMLTPGRGYFFYVFGNPEDEDYNDILPATLTMSGREHHPEGDLLDFNVSMSSSGDIDITDEVAVAQHGWNLVGNPFGATINWDDKSGNWVKNNMDDVIYIWKPEVKGDTLVTGQYLVWNGDTGSLGSGLIAPFQAFWVKASEPDPELQVHPGVKSTGGQFRQKMVSANETYRLVLRLEAGGLETRTWFGFSEHAKTGFDSRDAFLLEPMTDTYLMLYSVPVGGEVPLVINNLPKRSEKTYEIPIGAAGYLGGRPIHGEYRIYVDPESNIPDNWTVKLKDNVTGKVTDLQRQTKMSSRIDAFRGQQVHVEAPSPDNPVSFEPRVFNVRPDTVKKSKSSGGNAEEFSKYYDMDYAFTLYLTPDTLLDHDVPHSVFLNQNYPNPFNPSTVIKFGIPSDSSVQLEVFDVLGRRVQTLATGRYEAGVHTVSFDGSRLASGVYLYRLRTDDRVMTRKMMLVR